MSDRAPCRRNVRSRSEEKNALSQGRWTRGSPSLVASAGVELGGSECTTGYPVAVISDCVFDRSELSHQVSLFDMHLKYATVIPVSTACDLTRNA